MYASPESIVLERKTFHCVLRGEERARAHGAILDAFNDHGLDDVLPWVEADPSLFVEPLTLELAAHEDAKRFPRGRAPVWQQQINFHGTWAHRAATRGLWEVAVRLMKQHGLHPDETAVFQGEPLLNIIVRDCSPDTLRQVLDCGAETTPWVGLNKVAAPRGYLRTVLLDLRKTLDIVKKSGEFGGRALSIVKCAHLLLDAGDRFFDVPLDVGSAEARQANVYTIGAVGILCDHWPTKGPDELVPRVMELMGRLVKEGADINRSGGPQVTPPVVMALRCLNVDAACHLIGLGARTDDAFIVRAPFHRGGVIKPLLEEAREAGGEPYVAAVTEAIMRRRVAQEAANASPIEPAPRQRARQRQL